MRWKYWSLISFLLFSFFVFFGVKPIIVNYMALGILCLLAIAIALYECHEIWTLKVDQQSPTAKRKILIGIFISVSALFILFLLRSLGKFVWSDFYLYVPFALMCGITSIAAWLTEWRKNVYVYAVLEGFVFVSALQGEKEQAY